jgi:hypothetical protein
MPPAFVCDDPGCFPLADPLTQDCLPNPDPGISVGDPDAGRSVDPGFAIGRFDPNELVEGPQQPFANIPPDCDARAVLRLV